MRRFGNRERLSAVMGWWRRRPEVFRDAVGAVPLVLTFLLAQQIYGAGGPWSRAVTIVAVMWGALAVRRRWPILTFAAALLTVVLAMTGLEFLAVAGYTLVAYRPRIPATFVVVVSAATTTAGFLRWWPSLEPAVIAGDLILILGVSILPAVLGKAIRRSRRVTAELQTRNAELVALREEAAEHAVQRERFRIARDLHDVVAHHVSAMTVRAGAGHHVASRDPQAAVDALDYVAHEGADALAARAPWWAPCAGRPAPKASGTPRRSRGWVTSRHSWTPSGAPGWRCTPTSTPRRDRWHRDSSSRCSGSCRRL